MTLGSLAHPASAQEKNRPVKLAPSQAKLIEKGVEASDKGDYEEAIRLYTAALEKGEANLVYLNLGRAYQKGGDCWTAEAFYQKAFEAPVVVKPSKAEVEGAIGQFLVELRRDCPGAIKINCSPGDMKVHIDGQEAVCGERIDVPPGAREVTGEAFGERVVKAVEVTRLRVSEVSFLIQKPALLGVRVPRSDAGVGDEVGGGSSILAWSLVGVGALLVGGGALMGLQVDEANSEIAAEGDRDVVDRARADQLLEDVDTFAALQWVGLGLGSASVIAGVIMLVLDEDGQDAVGVGVWGDGVSLGIEARVGF